MKIGFIGAHLLVRFMRKSNNKLIASYPKPEGMKTAMDIAYGEDKLQKFDVYYADKKVRKNKVVIDIHGGSYIEGTRKANYPFGRAFLDEGYDFVSFDYRSALKRGVTIYGQLRDLTSGLKYLADQAEELGLNADEFYLTGDSAGGHFCFFLAELQEDKEKQERLRMDLGSFHANKVAVNCPVYDFVRLAQGGNYTKGLLRRILGPEFANADYLADISPKANIDSLKIPLFVSTCRNDFLKQETFDAVEDLKGIHKDPTYHYCDAESEEIAHVYNIVLPFSNEGKDCNEAMIAFFKD